jgi:hypothetical protein
VQTKGAALSTQGTRDRRPLVFFGVLMSHVVIVLLLMRAARQPISSPSYLYEPLVLMDLRAGARAITNTATIAHAAPPQRAATSPRAAAPSDRPQMTPLEPSPQRKIDWEHEAELAAQNAVAGAEKQKNYRDLSALSPEQLSWIRENHMEPMPAGIQWTHPRFEFDSRTGLPVLWINDHCVLVMLMVFCGVGHVEANGDLFKHMHDPHDP